MDKDATRFLYKVAEEAGYDFFRKKSFLNPLENDMFRDMVHAGLKALEGVALVSLDFKLTAIVKLLQSWIKDKEAELEGAYDDSYNSGYYY